MSNSGWEDLSLGDKAKVVVGTGVGVVAATAVSIAALVSFCAAGDWLTHPEHSLPSSEGIIMDLKESPSGVASGKLSNGFTFVANTQESVKELKELKEKNERVRIYYYKDSQIPTSNIASTDNTGLTTTYKQDFTAPGNVVFKVEDGRITYVNNNVTPEGSTIKTFTHESDGAVSGTLSNGFNFYANDKEMVNNLEEAAHTGQKVQLCYEKTDGRPTGSAGSATKAPTNIVYRVLLS